MRIFTYFTYSNNHFPCDKRLTPVRNTCESGYLIPTQNQMKIIHIFSDLQRSFGTGTGHTKYQKFKYYTISECTS